MSGLRLGVDLGTSHTVAVLAWPDGRTQPLLFDGTPLLPSAVFAADDQFLTGRDAQRSAHSDPSRFEPNPKRRIDDGTVLLGDRQVPVIELIATVLARVWDEAVRVGGARPAELCLTCPAGWGTPRRDVLLAAARHAGLPEPSLLPEPIAAASYFTAILGHRVPVGSAIVVYDFGAGTFDVSVVLRRSTGWRVLASDGLTDVGGLDLDALVIEQFSASVAERAPATWRRLSAPATPGDRGHRRMLWDDARQAKEQLSRSSAASVHVPLIDADVPVGREEFERLAGPVLERTVALTATTMAGTGLPRELFAGLFLVGGSSRTPLVATRAHQRLGLAPVIIEQPELVVAQGSVRALPARSAARPSGRPAPGRPRFGAAPASGSTRRGTTTRRVVARPGARPGPPPARATPAPGSAPGPPRPATSGPGNPPGPTRMPPHKPHTGQPRVVSAGPPPVTLRRRRHGLFVAGVVTIVIIGALAVGVAGALLDRYLASRYAVGSCVTRHGDQATPASCSDPDTYRIRKRVSDRSQCPDPEAPAVRIQDGDKSIVGCLEPVR